MKNTRKKGFSLIELLIVVAIIAALVGQAMIRLDWVGAEARANATAHNRKVIQRAIDEFRTDRRRYPSSLHELVETRYLREIPVDPTSRANDTWKVLPSAPGAQDVHDIAPSQEARP